MSDDPARPAQIDRAAYDSGGAGSALLLLHGLGGTWHAWRPVLPLLERRHRVIALTLPGHDGGPDYTRPGDATVDGLAEQVISMMTARGIARAHVAGNSLGGWLSLELARRGFARSVTAFSPAGGWRTLGDYDKVARPIRLYHALMPLFLVLTFLFLWIGGFRRWFGRKSMEHSERVPVSEFRAGMRALRNVRIFHGLLRTLGRDGPVAPLSVDVPIRIAWCEQDRVIPFMRYGRPMLDRVPRAESRLLPGVGHVPMFDDPPLIAGQILEVTGAVEKNTAQSAEVAA